MSLLGSSTEPLVTAYDAALLDLDGVVYVGPEAVPGAPEHLRAARAAGLRLAFVTNNASRPPHRVAQHLNRIGVEAATEEVVTSAQAAARVLSEAVAPGSSVFVIGGEGLFAALQERGLVGVQESVPEPEAVVSGYHPDLAWGTVIEGAILVKRGLAWVASNTDLTVPTALGPGPGNGVLVQAVSGFAGRVPVVAGKPEPPLFSESAARLASARPLVVGDRLDTDIEGAQRAGMDSLLVMTGVTGLAELVAARPEERPTYVGSTLAALSRVQEAAERIGEEVRSGGWTAGVADGRLVVVGKGDPDAWWQAVAVAAWTHRDRTGRVADVAGVQVPGSVAGE